MADKQEGSTCSYLVFATTSCPSFIYSMVYLVDFEDPLNQRRKIHKALLSSLARSRKKK